jgi:hypothetical protein
MTLQGLASIGYFFNFVKNQPIEDPCINAPYPVSIKRGLPDSGI